MMEELPIYVSIVLCFVKNLEIIKTTINEINKKIAPRFSECDIVLVDNSGSDKSWKDLLKLRDNNLNLKVFKQEKVTSYDNAIFRGFKESRGNFIILLTPGTSFYIESILDIFEYFREFSTYRAINSVYVDGFLNKRFKENSLLSNILFEELEVFAPVLLPSIFVIKKSLFERVFTFMPMECNCFLPLVEALLYKYFPDEIKLLFLNKKEGNPIEEYGDDANSYSLFKIKKCQSEIKETFEILKNIEGIYNF